MKRKFYTMIMVLIIGLVVGCNQFSNTNTSNLPELKEAGAQDFDKILAQYRGKVVLVNFFASWCPPCKAETPEFVATYNKLKDKGFVIIGFSIDDDLQKARQFIADYKISYPTYHAQRDLEQRMAVSGIPKNIFFTKDGTMYKEIVGALNEEFLEKTFEELSK